MIIGIVFGANDDPDEKAILCLGSPDKIMATFEAKSIAEAIAILQEAEAKAKEGVAA